MASKARDLMTTSVTVIKEDETVLDAARKLKDEDAGALPICTADDKVVGMLTDRDIVVKVLAEGKDPATVKAGDLIQGEAVTIGADDDVEELARTMKEHKVRRLPVIDGHKMVGIVAQADVARALPPEQVGDLLETISS